MADAASISYTAAIATQDQPRILAFMPADDGAPQLRRVIAQLTPRIGKPFACAKAAA